ncbi:hypothetical protein HPG69_010135 [Diceros bicornis minor]|uniref:Uncharacterized protein n=1 Tax=Diceros bicornis minor TaxID=77932 RepID=A0A7J7EE55_DICBM|nr:hypothetical protein HPG69_010135 [Diceros bicornis minor]
MEELDQEHRRDPEVLALPLSRGTVPALANLVAAFEQSLVNMTSRLRHLAETAEEKDTELLDLRETIDFLKKKNSEAQAVIQGALNASETTPKAFPSSSLLLLRLLRGAHSFSSTYSSRLHILSLVFTSLL